MCGAVVFLLALCVHRSGEAATTVPEARRLSGALEPRFPGNTYNNEGRNPYSMKKAFALVLTMVLALNTICVLADTWQSDI